MLRLFHLLLSIILFVNLNCVKGQDAVIMNEELKYGVYRSFKEFQQNRPSIEENFKLHYQSNYYGCPPKYVKIRESNGDYKVMKKGVWGYSDTSGVYIFGRAFGKPKGFTRIDQFGRYCVFEVLGLLDLSGYQGEYHRSGGDILGQKKDVDMILDMETGNICKATKNKILECIKDDQKLYRDFKKNGKKTDVYMILEKYNKRHPIQYPFL
jgi:hypothetical protein